MSLSLRLVRPARLERRPASFASASG